jgi:hypothetical protein
MMTIATIEPDSTVTQEDYVLGVVLSNSFRTQSDGWLYPQGDEPLVRVSVTHGVYCMERRRMPQSVWMRIVEANIQEFDERAFTEWVENWSLTV